MRVRLREIEIEKDRLSDRDARAFASLSIFNGLLSHSLFPSISQSGSLSPTHTQLQLTLSQKHKYGITGTMTESEKGREKIAGWREKERDRRSRGKVRVGACRYSIPRIHVLWESFPISKREDDSGNDMPK